VTTPTAERRFLLDRSPMEIAVFEMRFPALSGLVSIAAGMEVRDLVAGATGCSFSSVDRAQAHEVMLTLNPDGTTHQQASSAQGVQIVDGGSGAALWVFPGQLAVQVQAYTRWSVTLRPLIDAALVALKQVLAPAAVARVGLRYINRFQNPRARDPGFWARRIEPSLAGPLVGGPFAGQVVGAQHQLELNLGAGLSATIRRGLLPEATPRGTYSYLIDLDVYKVRTEPFEAAAVLAAAEALNRQAAHVFRRTMRTELAQELGLHDVGEGGVTP